MATCVAAGAGTPWATRPVLKVWGRLLASPAIISEKNRPIDSTMPLFMNVARMPDAAPRWLAGTAFMMAVVLGAANRPEPTPLRKMSSPNTGYEKLAGSARSRAKLAAVSSIPPVAKGRAP